MLLYLGINSYYTHIPDLLKKLQYSLWTLHTWLWLKTQAMPNMDFIVNLQTNLNNQLPGS